MEELRAMVLNQYQIPDMEDHKFYDVRELELYFDSPIGKIQVNEVVQKRLRTAIVHLTNGISFVCSQDHLVQTTSGVKQVNELEPSDAVASTSGPVGIGNVELSDQEQDFIDVSLAGTEQLYYTADGVCHHNTGKTHTVEKVLAELGLRDGDGYYKQTGSSSAIGVYATLFNNRDGIVLFDDCDGALSDQDARNVIKAATDTKKERKLAWGKRSSMMYDPEQEDDIEPDDIGVDKFPRFYFFKGRIIFISNLPIDKLDPDGALRTRAFMVDINPTRDELLDFMEKIVHKIPLDDGLTLDKAGREAVVRAIRADKRSSGLSIRKLVRSMNLAATGVENWEELVQLYC